MILTGVALPDGRDTDGVAGLDPRQHPEPDVRRKAPNRAHFVLNLAPGLPLLADHVYTWRVSIDGETQDGWATSFYVRQDAAGVVVG